MLLLRKSVDVIFVPQIDKFSGITLANFKLYIDRLSNGPSATVSVAGEPLKKKSRKEQRKIEAAKGQAERLALMKLPTALQVMDKKDHKIQKQIGLSVKFTGEVEFRAKKVLELNLLLDLATDVDIRAIRLKIFLNRKHQFMGY